MEQTTDRKQTAIVMSNNIENVPMWRDITPLDFSVVVFVGFGVGKIGVMVVSSDDGTPNSIGDGVPKYMFILFVHVQKIHESDINKP